MKVTVVVEVEKGLTHRFLAEYNLESNKWTAYHETGHVHDDDIPGLGEALGLIVEDIEKLEEYPAYSL